MKLFEVHTQCGAKIQAGKLTEQEMNPILALTYCPIHERVETCSIKMVEVKA